MKRQRMLRISLLLCLMMSVLWTMDILVKAEQIDRTVDNQTAETKVQEEVIQIEDVTGLDAEFETLEEESVLIVEEVEQYRREAKRKRVQKIVVVILVIAILGVGISTRLQEKKKNDSVLTDQEKRKEQEGTGGQT